MRLPPGESGLTDGRPHASDCLLVLSHLKLDSNRVAAYLPAWRNELAKVLGDAEGGAMILAGGETSAHMVGQQLIPQMSLG
jgi:hypothetical protein